MDFYQGVVCDYLRADRAIFLNTEFCLQKNQVDNPDADKPHWYVDVVAADFRAKTIYLCEITFSRSLTALVGRLTSWATHWPSIPIALARDAQLPSDWPVRPWLFVPEELAPLLVSKLKRIEQSHGAALPPPKITTLEATQPWRYRSWNRAGEQPKPDAIPELMR